jgi:superfamily II DNA or RNA helicase
MITIIVKNEIKIENPPKELIPELADMFDVKNPVWYNNVKNNYANYNIPEYYKCVQYIEEEDILYITRGYLIQLLDYFERRNIDYEIDDRTEMVKTCNFNFHGKLRPYQEKAVEAFEEVEDGVLCAATGGGKCLAKGTGILMYDGSTQKVENIKPNDYIMGDDSKKRKILSITNGVEEMFKISPVKGKSYTVNKSHILSLKVTGKRNTVKIKINNIVYFGGDVVDICVADYLKLNKTQKHCLKGYRVPLIFRPQKITVNPYFLGIWLGDGRNISTSICTPDKEVVDFLEKYLKRFGYMYKLTKIHEPSAADTYNISLKREHYFTDGIRNKNKLFQMMEKLNVFENKHIPDNYKKNTREVQLQVLAGCLDSDGYLGNNSFEILSKYPKLAEDICFIARSLGFAAYSKKTIKSIKETGFKGEYYKVTISGNIEQIPTKIKRKQARVRKQKKDVLVTGINVKSVGMGEYYGFEIDGNRRFVLSDFTVTHNTVISLAIIASRNVPTIIVVHTKALMLQWQERINTFLKIPKKSIGLIGGGKFFIKNITIATIQTLYKRNKEICHYFGQIIYDECHKLPSKTFQESIFPFYSTYFLGLTATPYRRDGLERLIFSSLGDIIHTVDKNLLTANKNILVPKINIRYTNFQIKPVKKNGRYYLPNPTDNYTSVIKQLSEDEDRNYLICEDVLEIMHTGMCIILTDRKHHCKRLKKIFDKNNIYSEILSGSTKSEERKEITTKLNNNEIPILIATGQLIGEGFDCKHLTNMFLVMPIKFSGKLMQYVGRILRPGKNKTPRLYDYIDKNIGVLQNSGNSRQRIYNSEFPLSEFQRQQKEMKNENNRSIPYNSE